MGQEFEQARPDAFPNKHSGLQRRARCARHRRPRYSIDASVWIEPRSRLFGSGCDPRPDGTGFFHRKFPVPLLVHCGGRQERRRHCRPWHRVSSFPDRLGVVVRAIEDHASPGIRARQPSDRDFCCRDRWHGGPLGRRTCGGADPRYLPRIVLHRHRHRGPFKAGTAQHKFGPSQLRDPSGAGPCGGPDPAFHLDFSRARMVRLSPVSLWRSRTPRLRLA